MATQAKLADIREHLWRLLNRVPGVGAVAVAWAPNGERCLRVSVNSEFRQTEKIPASFEGFPVTIQKAEDASFHSN